MDVLFVVRLVLAGVLLVAGLAKMADLPGSRQAVSDFGVPATLAAPLGLLLPIAEIALALALLPAATAWIAAVGALALFLLFIIGISLNLARGRTPNCHCFGQLHSEPIGRATLARNGVLAAGAGFVALQGPNNVGPGFFTWLGNMSPMNVLILIGVVALLGVLVLQTWAIFNLLRQNGRLLLRLEAVEKQLGLADPTANAAPSTTVAALRGLPVGTPAPAFQLPALDGTEQSIATLLAAGKPLLLVFSSASCGPCVEMMGEVAQWQQKYAEQLTIAVINRGSEETVRAKAGQITPATALVQRENEVAAAYLVNGTPSAVLVSADGLIRTSLAEGAAAVRELVTKSSQPLALAAERLMRRAPIALDGNPPQPARPASPAIGTDAPPFRLPDLKGQMVGPEELRGQRTLLLFWNPTCGFCRRMLDDLQAWETNKPSGAPRLVLISTGNVEANEAQKLASTTLLENGFGTGYAFGAKGTPSAILLDEQGKIAGSLVVGASAIMPLLAGSAAQPARPLAA
jgi:thiol-disulfide isomerase/thioredoxin/uncharacterized membrane protein YphA (DoxX/SURF4 family)